MTKTLIAKDISLEELTNYFGLQISTDANFFPEWQENLSPLNDEEKRALQRLRSNYFNLINRRPLLEEAVKMVVLSPLLDLAGFYQPPFSIKTEEGVEITAEDGGIVVKGNIDVLVIQQQLWVLVIESKSTRFDVMVALPQALAYMLNSPPKTKPIYGLLVNGREFVFVKLTQQETPYYNRSYALSIERENEWEQVLSVLKRIAQMLII